MPREEARKMLRRAGWRVVHVQGHVWEMFWCYKGSQCVMAFVKEGGCRRDVIEALCNG